MKYLVLKPEQACTVSNLHRVLLAGFKDVDEAPRCVEDQVVDTLAVLIDKKKLYYYHVPDGDSKYSLVPFTDDGEPMICSSPYVLGDSGERAKEVDTVISIERKGVKEDPGRQLDPLVDYVITWYDEGEDHYWTKDCKEETDIMHSMVESYVSYDDSLLNAIIVQGDLASNVDSLKELRGLNVRVVKRTINITLAETLPGPLET